MREAHDKGDWQTMYDLMEELHSEDFDWSRHMRGNYHMGGMMGGWNNGCHDNTDFPGQTDTENGSENQGVSNSGSFRPGMMGRGFTGNMMGW